MADDPVVRDNRLRLMRAISETCMTLARLDLLGG
jgi:glycyl-tRNA synthetase beta chain